MQPLYFWVFQDSSLSQLYQLHTSFERTCNIDFPITAILHSFTRYNIDFGDMNIPYAFLVLLFLFFFFFKPESYVSILISLLFSINHITLFFLIF